MIRVCGNPIFMFPMTVYGRLLGTGGGVSCRTNNETCEIHASNHFDIQTSLPGILSNQEQTILVRYFHNLFSIVF